MAEHLNFNQLQGYRDRTLALGELAAVDAHLGGCEPCRTELAGLADKMDSASMVAGIDQARFHHLSYEQMDDWVEDRLDAPNRELVMAHIGVCPECARQLIAYQEYSSPMAAPIRAAAQPVKEKQSFWAFLKQPHYALGAAALVAFFILTPFTRHASVPEETGAIVAPTKVESSVPEQGSPLAEEAVKATDLHPAAAEGGAVLEYPVGAIAEQQPVLRWKAFGNGVYDVTIYDAQHSMISRRSKLNGTQWTAPSALARGRAYSWEVESAGQKFHGTFQVNANR